MTELNPILTLIPARVGFKGILCKNVMVLAGKPLIAYSNIQAIALKSITRMIVLIDNQEVAEISCQWGAEVCSPLLKGGLGSLFALQRVTDGDSPPIT